MYRFFPSAIIKINANLKTNKEIFLTGKYTYIFQMIEKKIKPIQLIISLVFLLGQ